MLFSEFLMETELIPEGIKEILDKIGKNDGLTLYRMVPT